MLLFFLILAQAPTFTLLDLDKNKVVLDSLLKKGPVVLEFWATWCRPCIRSLDTFKKLNKEFENVTFVGINGDGPRTRRKVPLMVKSRKWDFLILYDYTRKVMKLFQIRAIPHTFVIAKEREILYQHVGFRKNDEEILRRVLRSFFEKSDESD